MALLLAFRDSYTSGFRARGRETGGVARVSNVVVSTEAVATEGVLPGDSNGDGVLDLSDAVHLLGLLFLGGSETPCAKTAGSIELVDCNGDGIRDLSDAVCLLTFLFMGGPPHALGLDCVPIASCPSACPE